jgi:hypothetical protein
MAWAPAGRIGHRRPRAEGVPRPGGVSTASHRRLCCHMIAIQYITGMTSSLLYKKKICCCSQGSHSNAQCTATWNCTRWRKEWSCYMGLIVCSVLWDFEPTNFGCCSTLSSISRGHAPRSEVMQKNQLFYQACFDFKMVINNVKGSQTSQRGGRMSLERVIFCLFSFLLFFQILWG